MLKTHTKALLSMAQHRKSMTAHGRKDYAGFVKGLRRRYKKAGHQQAREHSVRFRS